MALESNQRDRQALRDRLLEATLPHVIFDGWGMAALEAGARDLGLEIGHIHAVLLQYPPYVGQKTFSLLLDRIYNRVGIIRRMG